MLSPNENNILEKLSAHVKNTMPPESTAHDWPHVFRVWKNALRIAEQYDCNRFKIGLIALTHDLYDHKFFNGSKDDAKKNLKQLLLDFSIAEGMADEVVTDVFSLSFSQSHLSHQLSLEGKIVQDADRLEAIGAIGIARAFAFGGYKKRLLFANENKPEEGTTFDHFFDKLIKLYDLLNTDAAKAMAKDRFDFMLDFVKRFEQEWNSH
jgi:uncharacterized protein